MNLELDELQKIFPEIFEDGLINYDKFKTILGDNVDEKSEHYSFDKNPDLETL
jgi:hypothetical protein